MSIQNSINSMTTTIAGAIAAGKHAEEKKAMKEEQGMLAKEQYHEASAELKKLEGEGKEVDATLKGANEAYEAAMAKKPGGKGNTKASIAEGQKKALTEKEAAQRAFDELQDKIEAKMAMKSRAEAIMKRTST